MLSDVVAEELVRHRKRLGLTREQLAARCAERGWPTLTFGVIGSIETGRPREEGGPRRREVTVDELIGLGAALDLPPVVLISPLGNHEPVEVLPGRHEDAWTAYRWLIGEFPTEALGELRDPAVIYFRSDEVGRRIGAYRRHHNALSGFILGRGQQPAAAEQHLPQLAAARIEMHRARWWLPPLPSDVVEAIAPALAGWGYRQDNSGELHELPPAPPLNDVGGVQQI